MKGGSHIVDINIAVVDDARRDSEKLQRNIHHWFTESTDSLNNISCYSDGTELLKAFEPGKFHAVFLDILMNDINGIDTARKIRELDTGILIIFTTTSREYVFDAFTVHPFDYIIKPYDSGRIDEVLREVLRTLTAPEQSLTVRVGRSTYRIPLRKVSALLSRDHTVELVMTNGNSLLCSMTFGELHDALSDDPRFLLCNRGVIINMDSVSCLSREKDMFIMQDGSRYALKVRGRAKIISDFTQYQISRIRGGVRL